MPYTLPSPWSPLYLSPWVMSFQCKAFRTGQSGSLCRCKKEGQKSGVLNSFDHYTSYLGTESMSEKTERKIKKLNTKFKAKVYKLQSNTHKIKLKTQTKRILNKSNYHKYTLKMHFLGKERKYNFFSSKFWPSKSKSEIESFCFDKVSPMEKPVIYLKNGHFL